MSLYVDEQGGEREREALAYIFQGRAGGQTLSNYAALIGEVHGVHSQLSNWTIPQGKNGSLLPGVCPPTRRIRFWRT